MSGFNFFTGENQGYFDEVGNITDYQNLQISVGDLPLPNDISVENNPAGGGSVNITWTNNSGTDIAAATDQLKLVVLNGTKPTVMMGLAFVRSAETATILLPYEAGNTSHVYIFFGDAEGDNYSPSYYVPLAVPNTPTP
jgi:hypothetical protein